MGAGAGFFTPLASCSFETSRAHVQMGAGAGYFTPLASCSLKTSRAHRKKAPH
jgi:hypothetical protein